MSVSLWFTDSLYIAHSLFVSVQVDLLIVMGSSLKVKPVALIPSEPFTIIMYAHNHPNLHVYVLSALGQDNRPDCY